MCERQFTGRRTPLSYHFIIFAEELGAGQELVVLVEGDDGLRQLSEIQLEQGGHCVHICVTAENKRR